MLSHLKRLISRRIKRGTSPRDDRPELPEMICAIREAAHQGHVAAQVQWGDILLESIYLPSDPVRARQWYGIAASSGYGPAHNMLGRCHHFGWGGPVDLPAAATHYGIAAAKGDLWGNYNLAIMTMRGIGMTADLPRALALFRVGAEAGHPKSMNLLARFIEEGWHTPRDPATALVWYRRAAEAGDYRGQHNYATALLAFGKQMEALDWWEKALVDATTDVLLAMQKRLRALDDPRARDLLPRVHTRLTLLGVTTLSDDE